MAKTTLTEAPAAIQSLGPATSWTPDTDTSSTTDPLDADSDNGGVADGDEDLDGDGAVDPGETDPLDPADDLGVPDPDSDGDGVPDDDDNCPTDPNPGQEDTDGDGLGDACDEDEPTTDRVELLEAEVLDLQNQLTAIQDLLEDLLADHAGHTHPYLTGKGAGHNNSVKDTGIAH